MTSGQFFHQPFCLVDTSYAFQLLSVPYEEHEGKLGVKEIHCFVLNVDHQSHGGKLKDKGPFLYEARPVLGGSEFAKFFTSIVVL